MTRQIIVLLCFLCYTDHRNFKLRCRTGMCNFRLVDIAAACDRIQAKREGIEWRISNVRPAESDMTTMSYSAIQNEINQTNNLIKQYTGQTPKFFRPPYISVNNTMYSAIDMAFIQGTMHNDWDGSSSSSQIANSVTRGVKDGQIILLHDFQGNSATVQALPTIIESLKNQGYQFVTMSQLFEYKGKNANVDYKIWSSVYD